VQYVYDNKEWEGKKKNKKKNAKADVEVVPEPK
jgi:hypothetical protein